MNTEKSGFDYNPRDHHPFAVTVDMAVFTIRDDALQVLLIERGGEPYLGARALPGGFVKPEEDLDQAAARELTEETGLTPDSWHLEQLGSFGAPDRDPRMRVVTVAYWAICADLPTPRGGGDARAAALMPVKEIERGAVRLAFDHERIVQDAIERLRSKLEYTALAAKFCPPVFTIGQLRQVYEAVWRTRLDPGNFQRNVRASGAFRQLPGRMSSPASGRGRPAALWIAGPAPGGATRGSSAANAPDDPTSSVPDAHLPASPARGASAAAELPASLAPADSAARRTASPRNRVDADLPAEPPARPLPGVSAAGLPSGQPASLVPAAPAGRRRASAPDTDVSADLPARPSARTAPLDLPARPSASVPAAAPLLSAPVFRGRIARPGSPQDDPETPPLPRLPRREYAAALCRALGRYAFPAVTFDFRKGRENRHRNMAIVERRIGDLLRSGNPRRIRDGLSNILYWGFAQRPGLRDARVRAFREAVAEDHPGLAGGAQRLEEASARPVDDQQALLDVRKLQLYGFGHMSFATRILMFLDPARFPVLDLQIARAFAGPDYSPLHDLSFHPNTIIITQANARAYARWACWCRSIAKLVNETPEAPCRNLRAVDVERALFALAQAGALDEARQLLQGPADWTFDEEKCRPTGSA